VFCIKGECHGDQVGLKLINKECGGIFAPAEMISEGVTPKFFKRIRRKDTIQPPAVKDTAQLISVQTTVMKKETL